MCACVSCVLVAVSNGNKLLHLCVCVCVCGREQGIKYRGKEEAVGGFFSQIGQMHVVHHLWGEWS